MLKSCIYYQIKHENPRIIFIYIYIYLYKPKKLNFKIWSGKFIHLRSLFGSRYCFLNHNIIVPNQASRQIIIHKSMNRCWQIICHHTSINKKRRLLWPIAELNVPITKRQVVYRFHLIFFFIWGTIKQKNSLVVLIHFHLT